MSFHGDLVVALELLDLFVEVFNGDMNLKFS